MATFTSTPPQPRSEDIRRDERPQLVGAATRDYGLYVHRTTVGRRVELAIFALFAALVSAALLTACDALLRAAGVKQPAAYDLSRAGLLWAAFIMAQSMWQSREAEVGR
jgi:hypothetical protein